MSTKLQKEYLSQQFVRDFMEAIIRQDLAPGAFIPSESEIAQQFGVSRTVVREGIYELYSMGLIRKRQGRRSQIAPRNEWDLINPRLLATLMAYEGQTGEILEDLFAVRILLESQAAFDAALRRTEDDLVDLRESLQIMEVSLEDPDRFIEGDLAYHEAIQIASHNLVVTSILRTLRDLLRASRTFTKQKPPALQVAIGHHRASYQAIQACDPEAARQAMRQHLLWSNEVSLPVLDRAKISRYLANP